MDLVERELDWVLSSPAFFSHDAPSLASSECVHPELIRLPGPLVHDNKIEYLTSDESSLLLENEQQKLVCLTELRQVLPSLTSGRLGLRFEQYLMSILCARFGKQNVLNRVPVREKLPTRDVKTWGEYDFLFFDAEKNHLEHWESSIKFYLQVKDDPSWQWCWGPGVIDRLDLKGSKTFLQQLPLSSTALGFAALPPAWQEESLVKKVFAKGTIFYHWIPQNETWLSRLHSVVTPRGINPEHLKSWWIDPSDVQHLQEHFPGTGLALIPRRYWMTGLPEDDFLEGKIESWSAFRSHMQTRSQLASERQECLFVGVYSLRERFQLISMGFIVTGHFQNALKLVR